MSVQPLLTIAANQDVSQIQVFPHWSKNSLSSQSQFLPFPVKSKPIRVRNKNEIKRNNKKRKKNKNVLLRRGDRKGFRQKQRKVSGLHASTNGRWLGCR